MNRTEAFYKVGYKVKEDILKKRLESRHNNGKPWHSQETIKKMSVVKVGHTVSEKTRELIRAKNKKTWADPIFAKKVFKSAEVKPNKLELSFDLFLQDNFPKEWKYVGDGEIFIAGRVPDWININGKKQLIELFGSYWHKPEDEEIRKSHFKKFGFDTLVIWDKELRNKKQLLSKIKSF